MGTRSYKLHSIYTQLSFLSSDSLNSLNKIQAFDVILDATTESIPVNGENVQLTQTFTFLGSVIHSSTSCEAEVNRRLGRAWNAMNSLDEGVWRCRYLCKRTKVRVFRSLVLPVLLYSCET